MAEAARRGRFGVWWGLPALIALWNVLMGIRPAETLVGLPSGLASFYGLEACAVNPDPTCPTASGASLYDLERQGVPYAASWEYPFGTWLRVCRADQPGRCVKVVVLDRGPAKRLGRLIDLNKTSFQQLAPLSQGLVPIDIQEVQR